jgi:bifunctional ADP-heptose synthase (sugar kinase/adenylyltransferase)
VNEAEYEDLAEYNESHDALQRRLQVRYLLKTRGRNGIEVSLGPDYVFRSSGYRLGSADVVGAGDSTFSVASLALSVTDDSKVIAALANAAGAAKVMKQGTRPVTTFDVAGMLTRRPPLE